MGYLVDVTGSFTLPAEREAEVVAALRLELVPLDGWLDEAEDISSFEDLCPFVAAAASRDGDRVHLEPDDDGDPKWSDQAEAFYRGLARWVTDGLIEVVGEELERWRYEYTAGGLVETHQPAPPEPDEPDEPDELDEAAAPGSSAAPRKRWWTRLFGS